MPACALDQLVDDSSCLDCLSKTEKQAAFLAYGAKALAELGGPDYTDLNTLREAVSCWCVGGQRLDSFLAQIGVNAAVNSGAVETAPTIAEIRETVRCYICGVGGPVLVEKPPPVTWSILSGVIVVSLPVSTMPMR